MVHVVVEVEWQGGASGEGEVTVGTTSFASPVRSTVG